MNNNREYWILNPPLQLLFGFVTLLGLYYILLFQQDWLIRLITSMIISASFGFLLLLEVFWLAGHREVLVNSDNVFQKNSLNYRMIYSLIIIVLICTFILGLYHILYIEKLLIDRFILFVILDGTLGSLGLIATVWLTSMLKRQPANNEQSWNYRVIFPLALVFLSTITLACHAYVVFIEKDWIVRIFASLTVDSALSGLFILVIFLLAGKYKKHPTIKNEHSIRKAKRIKILYVLALSFSVLILLFSSIQIVSVEKYLSDQVAVFISMIGTVIFLFIAATVWFLALFNSFPSGNSST